jgi:hypothetical protein
MTHESDSAGFGFQRPLSAQRFVGIRPMPAAQRTCGPAQARRRFAASLPRSMELIANVELRGLATGQSRSALPVTSATGIP